MNPDCWGLDTSVFGCATNNNCRNTEKLQLDISRFWEKEQDKDSEKARIYTLDSKTIILLTFLLDLASDLDKVNFNSFYSKHAIRIKTLNIYCSSASGMGRGPRETGYANYGKKVHYDIIWIRMLSVAIA